MGKRIFGRGTKGEDSDVDWNLFASFSFLTYNFFLLYPLQD